MEVTSWLEDRARAVVIGSAVGDALGGATEGYTPEVIQERYGKTREQAELEVRRFFDSNRDF